MSSLSDKWVEQAKRLATGQKRKIECCSDSPSAYISNNKKGVGYYCFRCGTKDFKPHGRRSIEEVLAARKELDNVKAMREIPSRCLTLYNPQTPEAAQLWVLQSGLSPEEASDVYGLMYDPKTQRVNIPFEGGFLARSINGDRPKYIKAGADTQFYALTSRSENLVIVCEDIMSAIKLYKAGYNAIAILGTAITNSVALRLSKFQDIICWTDGDAAGDAAWVKLRKKMSLYSVRIKRVRTGRDPKRVSTEEIKKLIGEQIW